MVNLNTNVWVFALNGNGINIPIKKHIFLGWTNKQDPNTQCIHEKHLKYKDTEFKSVGKSYTMKNHKI